MAQDVEAIDGAVETGPSDSPSSRRAGPWRWLAVGVAIGLGVGLLLVGSPGDEPSPSGEESPSGLDAPLEDTSVAEIGALLPRVVGIESVDGEHLRQIRGPISGPFAEEPLPVGTGSEVSVDQSGRWLAVTSTTPGGQRVLMIGRLPRLVPTAANVESFAWHDNRSGLLSYIENTSDGTRALKVVEAGSDPRLVATGDQLEGDIAAWGDWGWAIQRSGGSVAILDEEGEITEIAEGLALDSHSTGWIVTVSEGGLVHVVVPGGGTVWIEIEYSSIGGIGMASLSPDRKKIALVGPMGVMVSPLNLEGDALTVPLSSLPTAVSWSPDSRFVILSQRTGAMVLDTWARGDEQTIHELVDRSLLALSVVR